MSWRLGAGAGAAGLAVFAWGLYAGGPGETLAARVVTWPRSGALGSYAVQLLLVDDHAPQPLAREPVTCDDAPLVTDESGYLLFTSPRHHCATAHGSVTIDAPEAPPGASHLGEPQRARTTGVALQGPAPTVFLEAAELTVGRESLAFVQLATTRAQGFEVDPEPGLAARVVARCEDGVVLGLEPSYHVTGLHLGWGPLTVRERLDVQTPVSRGGPKAITSRSGDVQYAQIPEGGGWLAVWDEHGLAGMVEGPDEPWALPKVGPATLVATRGSYFDSAQARVRLYPDESPCARAHSLMAPWPEPADAIETGSGVEAVRATRRVQIAHGRKTAGLGLAGGALGLAAAILGARPTFSRALAGLGISLVLFAVLALLLYR